jgi:antitoxin MazE
MLTKVQKWGNSRAVRIPKAIAEEAGLDFGHPVEMRLVNGEIRIKRTRKRKRYDLDELLASVPDDFEPEEWDIGPPVGNEVW